MLEKVIAACVMAALVCAVTFVTAHVLYGALLGAGVFVGMWIEWARNKIARKVTLSFLLGDWPVERCAFVVIRGVRHTDAHDIIVHADVWYYGPGSITITSGRLDHVRVSGRILPVPFHARLGVNGIEVPTDAVRAVSFISGSPQQITTDAEAYAPVFFGDDATSVSSPLDIHDAGYLIVTRGKETPVSIKIATQQSYILVKR
ncbi:MAG: hypothetical protein KKI08_11850 [Armatimonadetes bacterium]|nr:hypothetical protein [Armatimonadota bacterium]